MIPQKLAIEGSYLFQGNLFTDKRGSFEESYNVNTLKDFDFNFVQDNMSWSYKNVLRGLHIQRNNPQGKFVRCVIGYIVDVFVDLRPSSPTFKKWQCVELIGEKCQSIYIPPGCAHGFLALAPLSLVTYKCTSVYDKESDGGINYNDEELQIPWDRYTKDELIISDKDKSLPSMAEWLAVR